MLKQIYNKAWCVITGRKSRYGFEIFKHRTWLERQIEEEQYKQAVYRVYKIR